MSPDDRKAFPSLIYNSVSQHWLLILLLALVILQILTWREVANVASELEYTRSAIRDNRCGTSDPFDSPCKVIIVQP